MKKSKMVLMNSITIWSFCFSKDNLNEVVAIFSQYNGFLVGEMAYHRMNFLSHF